jgi:ABC-2 type transport system ATP-binding protein
MQEPIVSITRLSHRYTHNWAIRDINMEIHRKGITGLLGSNGAGKSTTMNILCGALNQTEGDVIIQGINAGVQPKLAKKAIGFLPQNPPLYLDLTVDEYLHYCASLRLLPKNEVSPAVEEAKERCGVAHFNKRLLRNLSGGYRQRVGIAQAIVHKPDLVVLDEPTNGLDPNQITEIRALIRDIARERAVIFSSHVLSEVQLLCKDIVMIEGGRIVFSDTMEAFNNYIEPNSLRVQFENPPAVEELEQVEGVSRADYLTERLVRVYFKGDQDIAEKLVEASVTRGWRLREISIDKTALDEIFKQLSSKG